MHPLIRNSKRLSAGGGLTCRRASPARERMSPPSQLPLTFSPANQLRGELRDCTRNRKSFRESKNIFAFDFACNFCFQIWILTSRVVANGRFSALFRPCLSHFSGVIDTSTHPAHLWTIIYWPDWLTAPEPAGTSFFCTGNGGEITGGSHEFLHNSCHVHAHTALMRRP
jgi:hypothetical protein